MATDEQYVPSDEDMRWHYAVKRMDDGATRTHAEQEYTRWLAAHDARVRRDAWTEGCRAAEQYYRRTVVGIPGLDPIPAPVNPHEETP